jgi:hypothetical protein
MLPLQNTIMACGWLSEPLLLFSSTTLVTTFILCESEQNWNNF